MPALSPLLLLAIGLYGVNSVMFAFLSYFYGKTALSTRAKYAVGLFIFSVLLLAQSLGTAAAYFFLNQYFDPEAVPFMAMMGSFEFVGVLALLRITL